MKISAGGKGLPEEVLAASFPLPGSEERSDPGSCSPLHVDVDLLRFSFSQREVLVQSLVLHLQEV